MKQSRILYLAIAALTLATQVAAAAHSPAFHEEPISKCRDMGAHFCAEMVAHETGPCILCQVFANGLLLDFHASIPVEIQTEPIATSAPADIVLPFLLSVHSPRGPPVG